MKTIITSAFLMLFITIAQGQTVTDSNPLDSVKLPDSKMKVAPIQITDTDLLGDVKLPDDTTRMPVGQITYSNPWQIVQSPYGKIYLGPANSNWAHIYTDRSRFIFNKDVYTTTNAFSSYNNDLILKTRGTERFRIEDVTGNVGIGTTNPQERLHLGGAIRGNIAGAIRVSTGNGFVDIGPKNSDWSHFYTDRPKYFFDKEIRVNSGKIGSYDEDLTLRTQGTPQMTILKSNGNVGIGTTNPDSKLHVSSTYDAIATFQTLDDTWLYTQWKNSSGVRKAYMGFDSTLKNFILGLENGANKFTIPNGNVGIGTRNPDEKLTVKGKIHAEEVRVDLEVPADYVFQHYYNGSSTLKEDYTMPTLEEVEAFTKRNKHLPAIPSAKEIQKEGLHLKEMTNLLLQKIEELTLYTIEQEKRIKALEANLLKEKN